jgi:hypothetical protein
MDGVLPADETAVAVGVGSGCTDMPEVEASVPAGMGIGCVPLDAPTSALMIGGNAAEVEADAETDEAEDEAPHDVVVMLLQLAEVMPVPGWP